MGNSLHIELTIDDEVVSDFRDSFTTNQEIIAHAITQLDIDDTNYEKIDELFRSLHSIKGNVGMCQLDSLVPFGHAVENVVSRLRDGSVPYTCLLGEMLLLCVDKLKEVSDDLFAENDIDEDNLAAMEERLTALDTCPLENVQDIAEDVITLVTGFLQSNVEQTQTQETERDSFDIEPPSSYETDINLFKTLSDLLEAKLPNWKGRSSSCLNLANAINEALAEPVSPHQLEAAIYMHDIAFAFFQEGLVLKQSKFDDQEWQLMATHPTIAADMMQLIPGWEVAAEFIRQHHEHWDGKGYPAGDRADGISVGAQIIAVVDAYESMTHPRPDRQYKRSVLRAVSEINNCSGKQFSPNIVPVFNSIIRELVTTHD